MPTVGFEPTISAGERPQTYALERAAIGTGNVPLYALEILINKFLSNSVVYFQPVLLFIPYV
jgi:hypothetical protein